MRRVASASGHTLVEALVGMALLLVVAGGVMTLYVRAQTLARTHGLALELQQRARVVLDMIARDVRGAGAGAELLPGHEALLIPGVWPRRLLASSAGASTTSAHQISTLTSAGTIAQSTLASDLPAGGTALVLHPAAHCPEARPTCGFTDGVIVAAVHPDGRLWFGDVRSTSGATLTTNRLATSGAALDAGSAVTEMSVRAYVWTDTDRILRLYDGIAAGQPLIEDVTAFTVQYFDVSGEVPLFALGDGPWRGAGETLFDVDLLRIRRVRVSLRLAVGGVLHDASIDMALRVAESGGDVP